MLLCDVAVDCDKYVFLRAGNCKLAFMVAFGLSCLLVTATSDDGMVESGSVRFPHRSKQIVYLLLCYVGVTCAFN
jgi:hypothetical protein